MRTTNTVSIEKGTFQPVRKVQTRRGKIILPILLLLVLIGAAAGGYWYWQQTQTQQAAAAATTTSAKTTLVKTGNLTISASGSGTLAASQQSALSFSSSGTVGEVNVAVGDSVKQGQVLARLADLATLQSNVDVAQQNLILAQADLATLKLAAASNLAKAQLAVASAEKSLKDSSSALMQTGAARCEQAEIDADYQTWMLAKAHLDQITSASDGSRDYYLTYILPARDSASQAYSIYVWCSGYTEYEVDSSHANLAIAQASLVTAQNTLDTLQKNNGLDPIQLASAERSVSNAEIALAKAQLALSGAAITAPYDGVILSVAGVAGDTVGTNPFISIADLTHPQVKFYIDETDMSKLALGQETTVAFDAIVDRTFKGKVIQINPALQTVNNYQVVQGLLQLDLSEEKDVPILATGMNASVEIISGQAQNALLVPVAALRDLGDGSYSVFVVSAAGKTQLKVVEVGLQDAATAEIKSGLKAGDVITTGIVQTK